MNKKQKILYSLVLVFVLIVHIFAPIFTIRSTAAATSYSDVLDDLQKDESFNPDDYPSISDDNSIKVIQIAEGENGELFVYTYQPGNITKHRKANFVNMSLECPTSINYRKLQYKLYSLTWVNSNGVFDKYIVNGFTVQDIADRYYSIAGIYRPYDTTVDSSSSAESIDTVQCKSFSVGQYWHVYFYNNVLIYESNNVNVAEYKVYATGTVRYEDGIQWPSFLSTQNTDCHYVAIKFENFEVDQIIDADITYDLVSYKYVGLQREFLDRIHVESDFISSKEEGWNEGNGWLGKKYTWNRIMDVTTFKNISITNAREAFDETELAGLNQSEWVFCFAETPWTMTAVTGTPFGEYTVAENFGLLRVHFVSGNRTYNIGAVGDLVGTDSTPELGVSKLDNILNSLEEWGEWFEKIIQLLLLVLLFCGLLMIKPVFKFFEFVFKGIYNFIKVILKVILFPLRVFRKK